ncbi:MAG: DNA polymerase I [Spirochaetia bacterium]|nr:DNA polymerase I [Spirochaetia bacterium]
MSKEPSLFDEEDLDQEKLAQEKTPSVKIVHTPVVVEESQMKQAMKTVLDEGGEAQLRKKLYIIDGFGLIFRSYFAFITHPIFDLEGNNFSAVFGFFHSLSLVLREYAPDYLVVALDSKGPTFRHGMYPQYKANREAAPEELLEQIPKVIDLLGTMGIPTLAKQGLEADDIIATLCQEADDHGLDSVLFTSDKDLLQLVDAHVTALRPAKKVQGQYQLFTEKEVYEEFGVRVDQIVDYLSLVGDTADNVPGVKGIGAKGAVKLLGAFDTLENLYANLPKLTKAQRARLEEGREAAFLSKQLITLRRDPELAGCFDAASYSLDSCDFGAVLPVFEKAGAKSLVQSYANLLNNGARQVAKNKIEQSRDKILDELQESASVACPDRLQGPGMLHPVTSLEELDALLSSIAGRGGLMAFDTETTSPDDMAATLVGFSFTDHSKEAWYFPLVCGGVRVQQDDGVRKVLKTYLEGGKIAVIGQNIKYDYKVLKRFGVTIRTIAYDTLIAAWLLDSTANVYNMDALAAKYLHYQTVAFSDVVPDGGLFSDVPLESAVRYAAEDSDVTYRLYEYLELALPEKQKKVFNEMELPLIRLLAEMELAGIRLDPQRLERLSKSYAEKIAILEKKIFGLCGHEFNLNSTQQLSVVLFEERKLQPGKKTRGGYSTATGVLEKLKNVDPLIPLILDYRTLTKLKSTYLDALPKLVNEQTGRIHTSFLQFGTATGRLSSRNPNLQNIPIRSEEGRRVRSAFRPEEGCLFLSADYAQIELVVLAHLSGDPALCKAFNDGVDVHRFTASLIFGKSMEEITSGERRIAKTINFGVMYGMSAFRLAGELEIKRSEAAAFIEAYFKRYSRVALFINKTVEQARKTGKVETMGGHVRHISTINSKNSVERAAAERIAVNTVIQGTAAEIMKKGMLRLAGTLKEHELASRILLQVHDEVILEVPAVEVEIVQPLVKEALEGAARLSIPLRASIEVGDDWGDFH